MLFPHSRLTSFVAMKNFPPKYSAGFSLLLLAASACCGRAVAATNQWRAQVISIMVVAPEGGKGTRDYCWKPGVTVSAILSPAEGKIIKFNQEESKIVSFTDDKGTDLTAAPASKDPFNQPGISSPSSGAEGGEASIIVDLKAAGQPAKGATTLNLSGIVSAQVAGSAKQFTIASLEMKTNTPFSLGDVPVMITNVGTNRNSWMAKDYPYSVTFSSPRNLECIASLEFSDAQGNQIESRKSSWGGGFMGYMVEYDLKQNVDRAKLVVHCWQDLKTVEAPFSIQTGVGL
jgi:hypothetical protein